MNKCIKRKQSIYAYEHYCTTGIFTTVRLTIFYMQQTCRLYLIYNQAFKFYVYKSMNVHIRNIFIFFFCISYYIFSFSLCDKIAVSLVAFIHWVTILLTIIVFLISPFTLCIVYNNEYPCAYVLYVYIGHMYVCIIVYVCINTSQYELTKWSDT